MFKIHVQSNGLILEDCRASPFSSSAKADPPIWLRVQALADADDSHSASCSISILSNDTSTALVGAASGKDDAKISIQPPIACHAIYGFYKLLSGYYVAYIKDARVIGSGPKSEKIYVILELGLIPVSHRDHSNFMRYASSREKSDEKLYMDMIKSVFILRTFYFSYDFDLTLPAQRRILRDSMQSAKTSVSPASTGSNSASSTPVNLHLSWQQYEDDFFWNKPLIQPFLEKDLHWWIIPVINGFVKVIKKCEGLRCDLFLFTRRSWRRVGTRFNVRGVDKDGHVANFSETEMMIVKPNDSVCSYVQIRGSIPLYWDQLVTLKYMPRTRYAYSLGNDRVVDWNEIAFRAHMDNIIQRYGHITVVNLIDRIGVSRTIRDQAQLGSAFGKYVKRYNQQSSQGGIIGSHSGSPRVAGAPRSQPNVGKSATNTSAAQLFSDPISYVWFDFHHECRNMKWSNLKKLMDEVSEQFDQYGWFECDKNGRILQRQKGVFRVNCMDNLDRTNVVMSLFARRAILMALNLLDTNKANVLESPYRSFEMVFKNAWADNADQVSKMYAGTGALKTDFTRTGKRTLMGAVQDGVNSVTRYYLNNFADGLRQDSYDLVVANHVPDKREESPFTFQQQHSFIVLLLELSIVSLVAVSVSVSIQPEKPLLTQIYRGIGASFLFCMVLGHLILKKGILRSLGRRYVCKPAFCSSGYIKRKE